MLSCLGKLFTSIINNRLTVFSDQVELLDKNKSGFRQGYSSIDNICVLHILQELLKEKEKNMRCAFIDFEKTFDSVWRIGLWQKLLSSNINEKCFRIIFNIYDGIRSRIVHNGCKSEYFPYNIGVRQGENVSPFFFSLYLKDLQTFLATENIKGIESVTKALEKDIIVYLKLFVLLYADDTVLLAETGDDLQHQLYCFELYCETWKLKVKTKNVRFTYNNNNSEIEIVTGLLLSKTESLIHAKKDLIKRASKSMFALLKI